MANYKGIHGGTVQNFAGDPGNAINGQVWYDKAAAAFQYAKVTTAASWSTGGNLNTARGYITGFGNQTATLASGGYTTTSLVVNESYNGSSWTEVNDLNTARDVMGSSQQAPSTAALVFGGSIVGDGSALHESWNGTSWTEVNDMNSGRYSTAAFGTTTATIAGGGSPPDTATETESWNGTSWTEVNDLNVGRYRVGYGPTGTSTSGICIGGRTDAYVANVEHWSGAGTTAFTVSTT